MADNTTAIASIKASKALLKKIRQQENEEAAVHFALGIAGIVSLFALVFWARDFYRHIELRGPVFRTLRKLIRCTRRGLINKVPLFQSAGHALAFLLYLAVAVSVATTNVKWDNLTGLAKRLGWLTVLNLALCVFLSLKNTPLAFLINQSHERLNGLHRVAGYSTIASALAHALIYFLNLKHMDRLTVLKEQPQIMGITAASCFLFIFLTATFLRKRQYEAFYIIHVTLTMMVLIMAGLHRRQIVTTKSSYILASTALIWGLDRTVRAVQLFYYSFNNDATIIPLCHGGTRVILRKAPKTIVPGDHCYIWLPGIRALETHPFTCMATNPLEFIVSAHNGFTKDLHICAQRDPGAMIKASIHGPYGVMGDLTSFNRVVFISGGSGVSFTSGLAVQLLHKLGNSRRTNIEFIWAMREKGTILANSPLLTLNLFATRGQSNKYSSHTTVPSHFDILASDSKQSVAVLNKAKQSTQIVDSEKCGASLTTSPTVKTPYTIIQKRPDIAALISNAVDATLPTEQIAIVACGPDTMMSVVQRSVAKNIRPNGPTVEFFNEHFN
ncbi:Bgt-2680 [Blumeria graminis f. sp. tritici]|uniref:Bgt-2680 n=2 Tax=Blumeria graminis f. sp. tritici TaxID=62690 RepID=A0A9X9MMF1_BLUGR|nr:ferric reductase [Blumeria graminis f. sp. tritici 96224]VDB93209.1 Bgt-2680 [Blumeria graminis f. sp. tritici]